MLLPRCSDPVLKTLVDERLLAMESEAEKKPIFLSDLSGDPVLKTLVDEMLLAL